MILFYGHFYENICNRIITKFDLMIFITKHAAFIQTDIYQNLLDQASFKNVYNNLQIFYISVSVILGNSTCYNFVISVWSD